MDDHGQNGWISRQRSNSEYYIGYDSGLWHRYSGNGVADKVIFGVGVRIACPDERGNARPGCGMSDVRGPHFSLYIDAPNMRPALFGLDMATNRTGH